MSVYLRCDFCGDEFLLGTPSDMIMPDEWSTDELSRDVCPGCLSEQTEDDVLEHEAKELFAKKIEQDLQSKAEENELDLEESE